MPQEEPKKTEEEPIDPEVEAWIQEKARQYSLNPKEIEAKRTEARLFHPEKYKKYAQIMRDNDISIAFLLDSNDLKSMLELPNYYNLSLKGVYSGLRVEDEIRNPTLDQKKEQAFIDIDIRTKEWMSIKNTYDNINWEVQDEITGKSILEEMKTLIDAAHPLFMKFVEQVKKSIADNNLENPPVIPDELFTLSKRMQKLSIEYGELPAYQAYRIFGDFYFSDWVSMSRAEWLVRGKPRKTT